MSSSRSHSIPCLTDAGLLSEMSSGKVRWLPRISNGNTSSLFSGAGSHITCISISEDSEWAVYARRSRGVFAFKLRGGSGSEISLPSNKTGLASRIYAICIHKNAPNDYSVYVADCEGKVISWKLKNEHTTLHPQIIQNNSEDQELANFGKVTSILFYDNELYLAIKGGLRVIKIELSSGLMIEEWPLSPSPPIHYIGISQHMQALIISSEHRQLTVYSLGNEKTVQYLSDDVNPMYIDLSPHLHDIEYQYILSVNKLSDISIWRVGISNPSKKPLQPQARITLKSTSEDYKIINAKFSLHDSKSIHIAYGVLAAPSFTELKFIDESGDIIPKQVIDGESSNLLGYSGLQSKKDKHVDHVKIIGSDNTPLVSATFKNASDIQIEKSNTNDVASIPFGQLIKKQEKSKDLDRNQVTSRVTSAYAALAGALSANDRSQLYNILNNRNEEFIAATLHHLPVSQILPLLSELLSSFTQKPSLNLVAWARNLLIIHQSYLASTPDILEKLSSLYNAIDERLQHFPELLKLNGRFDLLLTHIGSEGKVVNTKKALQTYVESEDDLDMMEVSTDSQNVANDEYDNNNNEDYDTDTQHDSTEMFDSDGSTKSFD